MSANEVAKVAASVFRVLDRNGDGLISIMELLKEVDDRRKPISLAVRRTCAERLRKDESRLVLGDFIQMFTEMDTDDDGCVSLEEFTDFVGGSTMMGVQQAGHNEVCQN